MSTDPITQKILNTGGWTIAAGIAGFTIEQALPHKIHHQINATIIDRVSYALGQHEADALVDAYRNPRSQKFLHRVLRHYNGRDQKIREIFGRFDLARRTGRKLALITLSALSIKHILRALLPDNSKTEQPSIEKRPTQPVDYKTEDPH